MRWLACHLTDAELKDLLTRLLKVRATILLADSVAEKRATEDGWEERRTEDWRRLFNAVNAQHRRERTIKANEELAEQGLWLLKPKEERQKRSGR